MAARYQFYSFPDSKSLCEEVAQRWAQQWISHLHSGKPFSVALSGGRIAGPLFSSLVTRVRGLSTAGIHFFWADERCVPPLDRDSNFISAREFLLDPLRIPAAQVHRIHGEKPPATAAAEAEAELCRIASQTQDGRPVLDLVLLGMGEDGHVASLFPGESREVMAAKKIYRPVIGPKPPPQRITIGYAAIAAANEVWVVISGPGKEAALRRALELEESIPLGRVLRQRQHTSIFTDVRI